MYLLLTPDQSGVPAPAPTPAKLVEYALAELPARPGRIHCHRRDHSALAATLLAARVTVLPHGGPQPGTLWLEVTP